MKAMSSPSKFLKSTVKEIVITTEDKQTHSLRIEFSLPYVEDQLVWKDPHKKRDGYDIIAGNRSLLVSLDSSDRRQKKQRAKMLLRIFILFSSHSITVQDSPFVR